MTMKPFPYAHATHPQWRMAAALVLAQLRAQLALPGAARAPSLALLYITDHYASEAETILEHLSAELPEVTDWAGTVGVGIAANNLEYFDEPSLAVMLCDLCPDQYRVFSGVAPLAASGRAAGVDGFEAHTALVHADGHTPDLAELITEMADRTTSGYLFGGLVGSRSDSVQFAFSSAGTLQGHGAASGVFHGGLSGVAFGPGVDLVSRVTQGAQPVDRERTVPAVDGNLVPALDNEPALDVLLRELGISLEQPETAMPRLRATLVGLTPPIAEAGVRSPQRRGPGAARRGDCRRGAGGQPAGVLRAQRAGGARRPDPGVRRGARGAGARRAQPAPGHGAGNPGGRCRTTTRATHRGRGVRELRRPRRAALWKPERGAADRAACAGRCAPGRIFCRRRDRAPPALRLHRRAHRIHHADLKQARHAGTARARPAPGRRARFSRNSTMPMLSRLKPMPLMKAAW